MLRVEGLNRLFIRPNNRYGAVTASRSHEARHEASLHHAFPSTDSWVQKRPGSKRTYLALAFADGKPAKYEGSFFFITHYAFAEGGRHQQKAEADPSWAPRPGRAGLL
jgi:hypothetical protein